MVKRTTLSANHLTKVAVAARRAISEITGKIKLVPGEKGLTAEIQGAGNALDVQLNMVAGAGYPLYLPKTVWIDLT